MNRNELVKKALEAGIVKANTMKSVVLEEMLKGMEVKVKNGKYWYTDQIGREYEVNMNECEVKTDSHYDNSKGSLYLFAEDQELNAWEFDIIKRIARCRKKGQFKEDLEKTKRVIDLYLKEFNL